MTKKPMTKKEIREIDHFPENRDEMETWIDEVRIVLQQEIEVDKKTKTQEGNKYVDVWYNILSFLIDVRDVYFGRSK